MASDVNMPSNLVCKNDGTKVIDMVIVLPLYEMNKLIECFLKEIYENTDFSTILRYAPPEGLAKCSFNGANNAV